MASQTQMILMVAAGLHEGLEVEHQASGIRGIVTASLGGEYADSIYVQSSDGSRHDILYKDYFTGKWGTPGWRAVSTENANT